MDAIERLGFLESMGSIPSAVAAVAWLILVSSGAGRLLRLCLRDRRPFELLSEVVYIVAGLNLVALFGDCLGSLGWLVGFRSIWLLTPVALLGIWSTWCQVRDECLKRRSASWHFPKHRAIFFVFIPFAVFTLGPALCYPTGWDELVYHVVLPKRWYADGWPAYYADIPYSGFPSQVEILCWLVAPIESLITSRLLVWLSWIIGIWLLYTVLAQTSKDHSTSIVALSLAACPTSLLISANCYVEALLFLYQAAIFAILKVQSTAPEKLRHEGATSVLLGILVGGAAAVKLTGVIFLCIPLVWFASTAAFGNRVPVRSLKPLVNCLVVSALVALPFYIRPWILTGNPAYPYFANWFSSVPEIIETSKYHHAIGSAFGMRGILAFLATPFLIAFEATLYDGAFGWQLIVLISLAALGVGRKQSIGQRIQSTRMLIVAFLFYTFWLLTSQQARFALPAVTAVTVLAAEGCLGLDAFKRRIATAVIVAATIVSLPWTNAGYYFASWESLFGIWNRTEYVNDSVRGQYVSLVGAIDKKTSTEAKILLIFEHRSLFIPRACTVGTPFFQPRGLTPPEPFENPDRLMSFLQENDYSHVVIATQPIGPDQSSAWWNRMESVSNGFEACIKSGKLEVEWASEIYLLLKVRTSERM